MPHDIFICYSRSDRETADKLVGRLRGGLAGFPGRTPASVAAGTKEIEREPHAARAVVVLWSAVSRDSDFVLEEAEMANARTSSFRFSSRRVEYPYGFGRIQTADLVGLGWRGDRHPGFSQLIEVLTSNSATNPAQASPPAMPEPVPEFPARPGTTFQPTQGRRRGAAVVVIPAGSFLMGSPPDEPSRCCGRGAAAPSPYRKALCNGRTCGDLRRL